jgi:glutamyl-tRNA reductase
LPRNVDPGAASLAGITLLDLDDVKRFTDVGLAERALAADAARQLVEEAVARHLGERVARQADPTVSSLRTWAEDVRRVEFERYRSRLSGLTDRELEVVEALTHSLLGKLLHNPTVGLKEAAATPRGTRLAEAAAELFRLNP